MNKFFKAAVSSLLVLLLAMVSGAAAVAAEDRAEVVERLLDLSGMNTMVDGFLAAANQQLAAQAGQLEESQGRHLQEIMKAVFAPEQIRAAVGASIAGGYDDVHAAAVLEWYGSELGSRVRAEEERAQRPEFAVELARFIEASQAESPNPERVKIAGAIEQGQQAGLLSLRLVTELLRGMLRGATVMAPGDARVPTSNEIETVLAQQVGQLGPALELQMALSFLFSGRNLSVAENRRYLEYVESDAGQWFYERTRDGLANAMARSGRAFGDHTAVWTQDQWAAEPGDGSKAQLATAADEGRSFSAGNSALECIDEAYRRRSACSQGVCFGSSKAFAEACFEAATSDASLCAGVPGLDDLRVTVYWRVARCEERGTVDTACNASFGALQEHCARTAAAH